MGEELIHAPSINTDSTYSKQQNDITDTPFSVVTCFFPTCFLHSKKNKSAVDIVNTWEAPNHGRNSSLSTGASSNFVDFSPCQFLGSL